MTIKELMSNLEMYDDNSEVIIEYVDKENNLGVLNRDCILIFAEIDGKVVLSNDDPSLY